MKDLPPRPDVYSQIEDRRGQPEPSEMEKARAILAALMWQQRMRGPDGPPSLLALQAGFDDIGSTPLIRSSAPMPRPRPKKKDD